MPQIDPKDLTPVIKYMKVKYKDIFDMGQFYEALKEWLVEREWKSYDGQPEQWETYYSEKIGQSGAKENWIWWRLVKKGNLKRILS